VRVSKSRGSWILFDAVREEEVKGAKSITIGLSCLLYWLAGARLTGVRRPSPPSDVFQLVTREKGYNNKCKSEIDSMTWLSTALETLSLLAWIELGLDTFLDGDEKNIIGNTHIFTATDDRIHMALTHI
jgi:hypothetical protein